MTQGQVSAWRWARRDLRGGLRHLRLLMVCLALGVAVIAGIGTVSGVILKGIASQGQALLGGDLEVRLTNRPALPDERAHLESLGLLSATARLRAMVGAEGGGDPVLAELKAVDAPYPLYGTFRLAGGGSLQVALRDHGAVMDALLAERLRVRVGDAVRIGEGRFSVRGIIAAEPDRASEGFALGPSILIHDSALPDTALVQPGSLVRYHYRVKLPAGVDPAVVSATLTQRFPHAGWRVLDRSNGAPGLRRFVDQLGQFLTLVGLTALVVAGLGVTNAVTAYLERKAGTIATLKSLGVTAPLIFRLYLWQILLVALVAIAVGVGVGTGAAWLLLPLLAESLPVPATFAPAAAPLLQAAAFGFLVALAAALVPLARASQVPAARLFRVRVTGMAGRLSWRMAVLVAALCLLVIVMAVAGSTRPIFAGAVALASLGALLLLRLFASLIVLGAARLPRPRRPLLRLALASLHRPGSVAPTVITALGLGLTLFAVLAVIEANLNAQIRRTVPERAPAFFFVDVPSTEVAQFRDAIAQTPGANNLRLVPSLRGPVTRVKGQDAATFKPADPDEAWILRGDRGLTFSATLPEGNTLVAGRWWPANYAGPPLVSLEDESARGLGLKVGDMITVSVLGVDVEARIANLRRVNWESMGFNFALVYAPGTLEQAPHSYMATVEAEGAAEAAVYRRITRGFPTVSVVRMKEVLASLTDMIDKIGAAVRATGVLTILSGILVLIGAIAAGQSARTYDSVILKVLGATRQQVLSALLLEYALLGAAAGLVAMGLGLMGGWFVVTQVLDLSWQLPVLPLAGTVAGGVAITVLFGLAGTWSALQARPNRILRNE